MRDIGKLKMLSVCNNAPDTMPSNGDACSCKFKETLASKCFSQFIYEEIGRARK